MSTFEAAIPTVLNHESGTVIWNDNGRGISKWGITHQTAREFYPNCSPDDILRMTPQSAAEFYRMAFWTRYNIGLIEDQELATRVLDLTVNMGAGGWYEKEGQRRFRDGGITLLQKVIGIVRDGIIGPATAAAVNARADVLAMYKVAAEMHYRDLAASSPACAKDLQGWLNRLAK
jgi:lysozyme family protein